MSSESGTAGQLDIGGVFEATAEICKKCFGTVWVVALTLLVPAAIIVWLLGDGGFGGLLGSLVNLIASAWLVGAVIRVVQDVEQDGRVDWSLGEILGSVTSRLVWIILLQIVLGILIGIGLVLFVVPGVILALMWVVAMPALVVEDRGVFDSMSRSSELTRHNRMRILGVGIVIVLVYAAIALVGALLVATIPVVGIILLILLGIALYPYISILSAVLYYRLVELKEGAAAAVEETVIVEESIDTPPPTV